MARPALASRREPKPALRELPPELPEELDALRPRLRDPLACERLMDVLEKVLAEEGPPPAPALPSRALGAAYSAGRFFFKKLIAGVSSSHAPPEFHRHRFPGIDIAEVRQRIARFREVLKEATPIHAEPLGGQVFRIGRAR